MISIRCKECNRELISHPSKTTSCGCPNMATLKGDTITAIDLSKVIMLNSVKEDKRSPILSDSDLAYQESRRTRKVRKLDFEVR